MERSALVYILLFCITLGLARCIDNRQLAYSNPPRIKTKQMMYNQVAEFAIFALLTGVSACRIAVGNDYWVYRFNFNLIAQDRLVSSEPGFNAIVLLMNDIFGYDNYLPIFALFSILTCLFFSLALHRQGEYYAFSLFLLMTGGYYFNSLNSVRYYLALAIALYAMQHVINRDYLRFFFWILVGFNFHKSILLVIPVYLFASFLARIHFRKWMYLVFGSLTALFLASLIFCKELYRTIIFHFYPYYENSAFDNGTISYANIAKCLAVLVLCVICFSDSLREDLICRFYAFLNLFGLVIYCCGSFIPETSRIGFYMIVSQIFLIPRLLGRMKRSWLRNLCYAGVIICFLLYFALLLRGMYAKDIRLLPYRNWIFQ